MCLSSGRGKDIIQVSKSFDCVGESLLSIAKAIKFSKLALRNYNVKLFRMNFSTVLPEVKHIRVNLDETTISRKNRIENNHIGITATASIDH
jgi:hypothetical protein